MSDPLATAVAEGRCGDRLWLYATYHCNLACVYCLTESHPRIADRRELPRETMVRLAREARDLGFTALGVTGGEVFMVRDAVETTAELGELLPTVVLTNATLFTDRVLGRVEPLAGLDVAFQLSLDAPEADHNDALRAPDNFAKVAAAVPALRERGLRVRIATTVEDQTDEELERTVVRRGRAELEGLGIEAGPTDILPELTITAEGAFLHPFAPTVRHGVTDLDGLVSRQVLPLDAALSRFLRIVADQPAGTDVIRNIQ
jgi:uncharacterized Fe-S cluster-containing radical SAM superfamily protein